MTITRSKGYDTGYFGIRAGAGYEGKTKELDDAVMKEAKFLQKQFNKDIEIRFNTDQESGGAFLKDGKGNESLGLGAKLEYRFPNGISMDQYLANKGLSMEKSNWWEIESTLRKLPKDKIKYDVVIDSVLLKPYATTSKDATSKKALDETNWYFEFSTLKDAEEWIKKNVDYEKVKRYIKIRKRL
ncbi:MAG: hypothetical protein QW478_11195, partial [Candidatus Micrarchaeaceae archaeon]